MNARSANAPVGIIYSTPAEEDFSVPIYEKMSCLLSKKSRYKIYEHCDGN